MNFSCFSRLFRILTELSSLIWHSYHAKLVDTNLEAFKLCHALCTVEAINFFGLASVFGAGRIYKLWQNPFCLQLRLCCWIFLNTELKDFAWASRSLLSLTLGQAGDVSRSVLAQLPAPVHRNVPLTAVLHTPPGSGRAGTARSLLLVLLQVRK